MEKSQECKMALNDILLWHAVVDFGTWSLEICLSSVHFFWNWDKSSKIESSKEEAQEDNSIAVRVIKAAARWYIESRDSHFQIRWI
jgi:hypothetical protein